VAGALRAGIVVVVWGRRRGAAWGLAGLGAWVAGSAAAAARRAVIVVMMVTGAGAVVLVASDRGMVAALGWRTVWAGEAGTGTWLKLVNSTWLGFAGEAVARLVAFGRGLGLAAAAVAGALGGSLLVSPWRAAKLQRIAGGGVLGPVRAVAGGQGRAPGAAGGR
jgi:3-hydroxyisobutyrate dehydrogenase